MNIDVYIQHYRICIGLYIYFDGLNLLETAINLGAKFKIFPMEVDEALEFTKPLGCTQVLVTVVSCLAQIQIAILALSTVFIAEVIPHHCIVSELDYPVQPNNSSPASIVYDRYLDSSEETFRVSDAACYVYENGTQLCTEWEFDTDFIGKTIVTEV